MEDSNKGRKTGRKEGVEKGERVGKEGIRRACKLEGRKGGQE